MACSAGDSHSGEGELVKGLHTRLPLLVLAVGSMVVFGAQYLLRRRRHIDIRVAA